MSIRGTVETMFRNAARKKEDAAENKRNVQAQHNDVLNSDFGGKSSLATEGYSELDPVLEGNSSGERAKEMYYNSRDEYKSLYRPINRQLTSSVTTNDGRNQLVNEARAETQDIGSVFRDMGMNARNKERYNTKTRKGASKQNARINAQIGLSAERSNTINQARVAQSERNERVTGAMINIGRGMAASSASNASLAANSENQRAGAQAGLDAQEAAARNQTYASGASLLLLAMNL